MKGITIIPLFLKDWKKWLTQRLIVDEVLLEIWSKSILYTFLNFISLNIHHHHHHGLLWAIFLNPDVIITVHIWIELMRDPLKEQ